ncbi:MAG: DinB family protein [Gemmatimonadetes bacterium]|nr:DinB family protein [Gemmatimonadota bacterium]
MHPQLDAWLSELDACTAHARRLAERAGDDGFTRRPPSGKWSLGEHLAHLNLTTAHYLPEFEAIRLAQGTGPRDERRRYRRDLKGTLLSWMLEPPVRIRTKTVAAFVPDGQLPRAQGMAAFEAMQHDLGERARTLNGLDLNTPRIVSPFDARMSYNAWAALCILTAHQRHHLWLVEHP